MAPKWMIYGIISLILLTGCVQKPTQEINYELLSELPSQNVTGVTYVQIEKSFYDGFAYYVGAMLGGGAIKEIASDTEIISITYEKKGGANLIYFHTDKNPKEVIESLQTGFLGDNIVEIEDIEEKTLGGMTYYLSKGRYGEDTCIWKDDGGVKILGYKDSSDRTCENIMGHKYETEPYHKLLFEAEQLKEQIPRPPGSQATYWLGNKEQIPYTPPRAPGAPITDVMPRYEEENTSSFGYVMAGENINALMVGDFTDLGDFRVYDSDKNLCIGEIAEKEGKYACIVTDQSDAQRAVRKQEDGKLIQALRMSLETKNEEARNETLDLVFSIDLGGKDIRWKNKKNLTIQVIDKQTNKPIENATVTLYTGEDYRYTANIKGEPTQQKLTDTNGTTIFKDLNLTSSTLTVTKEGYVPSQPYVNQLMDSMRIYLPLDETYCGDGKCSTKENCETCPTDCRCVSGYECVGGTCTRQTEYTVDLPDQKGMKWNLSYTPEADKIKIYSSYCFYLNVYDAGGNEIQPYDANVAYCTSSKGERYPATGEGSASWFNWGGCANTKYYKVEKGTEITLEAYTDSCAACVCHHPHFSVYEEKDGDWEKVPSKNVRVP